MLRDVERGLVLLERFRQLAAAMMDLCEPANRRKVFRRGAQDVLEFLLGVVEAAELEQRAPERDVSGQIGRMALRPAVQVAIASSKRPARRYSSASAAKAMDAGSAWTRRFSSSIRGLSAIVRSVPPLFFEGAMDSSSSSDGNATGTV